MPETTKSNTNSSFNTNSLLIFHQNIQHLASRKEALEIVLTQIKPNIVVLTEHNMKTLELERFNLDNFLLTSEYSRTSTTGGGVVILSGEGLKAKPLRLKSVESITEDKLFECCLAKYTVNNWHFVLIGIYRTPQLQNLEFLNRLDDLLNTLVSLKDENNFVIAGDFNLNILNTTPEVKQFKNIIKSHGFQFLVDFPTRVTPTSSTAIDNILTNIDKSKTRVTGVVTAVSDHDGQILELDIPTPKHYKGEYRYILSRDFSENNMNTFYSLLSRENWFPVYLANVENKFDVFNNIFQYNLDLVFPKKYVKKYFNKKDSSWISKDIIEEQKFIAELTKEAKRTNNNDLFNKCKELNKEYKHKLTEAKKSYYDDKINKSDNICKKTWEIINKETGKQSNKAQDFAVSIRHKNSIVSDPLEVANCFNDHFIDVIEDMIQAHPKVIQSNLTNPNLNLAPNSFRCQPVTENEISKIILSLKNKLSSGHDEVPLKLIKYVRLPLLKPLVHLINSSLVSGIFPDSLKMSKVVPIFKKGEKCEINNYRPISVLPSLSKIYERVMYNQLVEHLQNNQLFDDEQHGFRKGKSVKTALMEFSETIVDTIDKGDKAIGIFMDLSKAFDSISHETLLNKLKLLGLSKIALNWFGSYLSNRTQYVEVSTTTENKTIKYRSSMKVIKHGVPQGSILGPLLFLCYVQGIPSILNTINGVRNKLVLYADDSNLLVSSKNYDDLETACRNHLDCLQKFFIANNLFLNVNKTNFMIFSTKQNKNMPEVTISIGQNDIEQINHTTFLGIEVDCHLSWDNHVEKILTKICSGLYILKRMSFLCNLKTLKSIYFAHIHSHVAYGLSIFGGTSKTNLDKILILQKKAIRIMLNVKSLDSVKASFSKLGILTVYDQYILDCAMTVRDQLHTLDLRGSFHTYNTRSKKLIDIPSHSLNFYNKKPSHMGSKICNHISRSLKVNIEEKGFQNKLKEFLLKKSCYSIDEFFL